MWLHKPVSGLHVGDTTRPQAGWWLVSIAEYYFPGRPGCNLILVFGSRRCLQSAASVLFVFAADSALNLSISCSLMHFLFCPCSPWPEGVHGGGRDVPGGRDPGDQSDQGPQAAAHAPVSGVRDPDAATCPPTCCPAPPTPPLLLPPPRTPAPSRASEGGREGGGGGCF